MLNSNFYALIDQKEKKSLSPVSFKKICAVISLFRDLNSSLRDTFCSK